MLLVARQSLLLAAKDMQLFARDRFGLAFALLLPLLFIAGFTIAMREIGPGGDELSFAMATQEEAGLSHDVIGALAAAGFVVSEWDEAAARASVAGGALPGFVLFPADFTQQAASGSGARIQVIVTGDDPAQSAALQGIAWAVASRIHALGLALQGAIALEGPAAIDFTALAELAARPPLASLAFEQVGAAAPFNVADFTMPGYLTMFVFFVAALGAESIARERQTQTLERLISNGVRRPSIVMGKMLGGVCRGGAQIALLWGVGLVVFGVDLDHSPVAVIAVSALLVLASSAFGVMLASFVRTVRSASSAAVLASLLLAPLGGCWWPLFVAPEWLQAVGKFTPHGWANDAFNKLMLFGARPEDVTAHFVALAGFAVVFLAVALMRFQREAALSA